MAVENLHPTGRIRVASAPEGNGSELLAWAVRLNRAASVDEALRTLTEAAQDLVGTHQAVATRLVDGWRNATSHVVLSGKYAEYEGYDVLPRGLGLVNEPTDTGHVVRLSAEALAAHPRFRGLRDAPGHPPLPDYLAAPVIGRDGTMLGLIQLSDKVSGEPFSEADETVVVRLAEFAATVVEGIEALDRERQASRRAEALEAVGRAIASQLDLQDVVQLATDAATELTGAAFGAFFYNVIGDRDEKYLLYTLSGAPREAFESFGMPRATKVFGPTFRGEGTVRLDDVTADSRYGRNPPLRGMPEGHLPVRSYLAVPVVLADGEVAGGMFFGHPDVAVFGRDAESIAAGIAGQAAIALANARLYDAAQRELERREAAFVERDHVAQVLQESLLPPDLPEIPGLRLAARYRPGASTVGGDFYDVFRQAGSAWGVVIGDICGRGPEAAARTALTRHSVRTAAMLGERPSTVLGIANESLIRHSRDRFATVWYGEVEQRADGGVRLLYAAGGHPFALLVRAGGAIERLEETGPLLGVIDDAALRDREVLLRPGDALVLYTDGLVEARQDGEQFGEERLLEAMASCRGGRPGTLADCLLAASAAFATSTDDDTAILVLGVTPT